MWRLIRLAVVLGGLLAYAGISPASADDAVPQHQAWSSTQAADATAAAPDDLVVSAYAGELAGTTYVSVPAGAGAGSSVVLRLRIPETASAVDAAAELLVCEVGFPIDADGQITPGHAPPLDCKHAVVTAPTSSGEVLVSLAELAKATGHADTFFALIARPRAPAGTVRLVFDATQTRVLPATEPGQTTSPAVAQSSPASTHVGGPTFTVAPGPLNPKTDAPLVTLAPSMAAQPLPQVATPPAVDAPTALAGALPAAGDHNWLVPRVIGGYLVLLALLASALRPRRADCRTPAGARAVSSTRWALPVLSGAALLGAPLLLSESAVYRVGLLLIAIVAAVGLHILVNWTGELSFAHAAFLGLPAFVGAHAALSTGPVLALPVSVLAGVGLGAVLGLPALRARGLYVALASLAIGAAVNSYLFTRTWLVGPGGGLDIPVPSLLGIDLDSSRKLFPVLIVLVLGAFASVWVLYRSTLTRSLMWVRDSPSAAAAYGISPNRHRAIAYCLAGAYSGLAGGLTVLWVQRLTAGTFPVALSFLYLLLVVLAGRGPLLGLALAVLLLQGSQLFISGADSLVPYVGPVLLLLILTRFPAGLNGLSEVVMSKIGPSNVVSRRPPVTLGTAVGAALIGLGVIAASLGWYEVGSTDQLWIQNQYLISGGVGGALFVLVGLATVVLSRIQRNHAELIRALRGVAPTSDRFAFDGAELAALPDQREAISR